MDTVQVIGIFLAGFSAGCGVTIFILVNRIAPLGYEDAEGFHYGPEPFSDGDRPHLPRDFASLHSKRDML